MIKIPTFRRKSVFWWLGDGEKTTSARCAVVQRIDCGRICFASLNSEFCSTAKAVVLQSKTAKRLRTSTVGAFDFL
jgi:hypothetical protein